MVLFDFILQLVSVLREVKYLEARQDEDIPELAANIYSNKEQLRQYIANLELMTGWYNKVMGTVLEVEFPLIQNQLKNIDIKLMDAENTINWTTKGIVF